MRLNVSAVARQCIGSATPDARVLCPFAASLGGVMGDRYQAQALLTLGLTLAKRDDARLRSVHVEADGRLRDVPEALPETVFATILAHVLRLCAAQLGETTTAELIAVTWPDVEIVP